MACGVVSDKGFYVCQRLFLVIYEVRIFRGSDRLNILES